MCNSPGCEKFLSTIYRADNTEFKNEPFSKLKHRSRHFIGDEIRVVTTILLVILSSFPLTLVGQVQLNLLKDINTYQENPPGNTAFPFKTVATVDNTTFFIATEEATGQELWKTTGSAQTASLVKDITPGKGSTNITLLTASDNKLYFVVNTYQLWTSDGTAEGTFLLKDFGNSGPSSLISVNSTLFFLGRTPAAGQELWKSDGTVAGTMMVKDLKAGTGTGAIHQMLKINSTLYFSGYYEGSLPELWKTDGTSAGTVMIKTTTGSTLLNPQDLVNANGVLYCAASGGLYKTDGTANGTVKIDIPLAGAYPKSNSLTAVDAGVYFIANQYPYQPGLTNQLWYVAPGQTVATLAKDLYPNDGPPAPGNFTAYNGKLYFTSWDSQHGYELWQSDGTVAGTTIVKDIATGLSDGIRATSLPPFFTVAGGYLYFISDQNGSVLTKTDGTSGGTTVVADIGDYVIYSGMQPGNGGSLYFTANDYLHGEALWISNGSAGSTTLIKDLIDTHAVTYISPIENTREKIFYHGYYYFSANDGAHGKELWRTDGTTNNTTLVKDINAGIASSNPHDIIVFKNNLYFTAADAEHGDEIWRSDGTPAGTTRVSDVSTNGDPQVIIDRLDTLSDKLLFNSLQQSSNIVQLWSSDGTPGGTTPLTPQTGRAILTFPLIRVNGSALLNVTTSGNGEELWKTDGTAAGTIILRDINPGAASSEPRYYHSLNGLIYFEAYDPATGVELYRSDGTVAGTYLVKDICPGADGSLRPLLGFSSIQGKLYFTGHTSPETYSVFRSDGTATGTEIIHTPIPGYTGYGAPVGYHYVNGKIIYLFINNGDMSGNALWAVNEANPSAQLVMPETSRISYADNLRVFNNTFYFINTNATTGGEIWKSDGTPAGTHLLKDINKGPGSSQARKFKVIGNAFYFVASDGTGENQFWKSDGICGTRKILNAPGEIKNYFLIGNRMILHINDPEWGEELFYYNINEEPALTCPAPQTITFTEPGVKKVGDIPFNLTVTATSGLPVTLISSDPAVASVNGTQVTIHKAGQVSITAYQAGNDDYDAAAPVTKTLIIQRLSQTITFENLGNLSEDSAPFIATVSASSGLPITLSSSNTAVATVIGLQITIQAPGEAIITATQPGNSIYLSATPVSKTIVVEAVLPQQPKLAQVITFDELEIRSENSGPFFASASADSGLPVTLSSADESVATVDGLQIFVHRSGETTITATQQGNDIYLPATPVSRPLVVEPVLATEYNRLTQINIYPNPTTGMVSIKSDKVITEIRLMDVLGNPVEFEKLENNSIDMTALSCGVYLLNIVNGSQGSFVKIIKE